jgi:hypothetical protein
MSAAKSLCHAVFMSLILKIINNCILEATITKHLVVELKIIDQILLFFVLILIVEMTHFKGRFFPGLLL